MSAAARALQALDVITPASIRGLLERQYPNAVPETARQRTAVATDIPALDAILPSGGFPKGRLCAWGLYGGATAILRAAALASARQGERVAWIDGHRMTTGVGWETGPLLIRPLDRLQALRAATLLLQCGGFSLVVLTGVAPDGPENVRLGRAAHQGGSAVVAMTPHAAMAGLRIASQIVPAEYDWTRTPHDEPARIETVRVMITATAMGWRRSTTLSLSVATLEPCAALDTTLRDRRGAL